MTNKFIHESMQQQWLLRNHKLKPLIQCHQISTRVPKLKDCYQMLPRMYSNWNFPSSLVRVSNSVLCKYTTTVWPSNFTPREIKTCWKRNCARMFIALVFTIVGKETQLGIYEKETDKQTEFIKQYQSVTEIDKLWLHSIAMIPKTLSKVITIKTHIPYKFMHVNFCYSQKTYMVENI